MTQMDRHTGRSNRTAVARADRVSPSWQRIYLIAALVLDGMVLVVAVTVADYARFGMDETELAGRTWTYSALGIVIAGGWWLALQIAGATDERLFGHGPEEYRRIVNATLITFGALAIVSLLLKQDLSRGYLAVAFPVGLIGLLLCRKFLRTWLHRRRLEGEMSTDVLVVGGLRSARTLNAYFERNPQGGLRVSGVWVPDEERVDARWLLASDRVPVLGSSASLEEAVAASGAGAVIVTDTEHLGPRALKELTWQIEALHVDLLVSPNVMDISTPRITMRVVGTMPFLHLEKPQYRGAARPTKAIFDRSFALAALLATSPLLIAAAVAVKVTSPGPIFYRSERIGVGGEPFQMLKFRSMVTDADQLKDELESDQAGVLFKKKDDPRVTKVGAFLRRYSIDELPQFINVLRGDMSVVGPRPPLRAEVEAYEGAVERRLLVKQGITGLWQVSGRSDLSWEETVRLDLDYVENWSLARDIQIIWRTLQAVVAGKGAY